MVQSTSQTLADLYLADETAWLETTANLIRAGQLEQVDLDTLAEYLTDMALRDRRETLSRLKVLIAHLLKWQFQPQNRSASWRGTIEDQREELQDLLENRTLHIHAQDVLAKAYQRAAKQAAAETGLPEATFPEECPWTLEAMLAQNLEE